MMKNVRWKCIFATAIALIFLCSVAGLVSAQTPVTPGPNDWPVVNYDSSYSRNSQQTMITKDNVAQLTVKWILNTGYG